MKLVKITLRLLIGLSILSTLTACVRLTVPTSQRATFHYIPLKQRQAKISKRSAFDAQGAFSLIDQNKKPVIANYHWLQQNRRTYRIRIASALDLSSVTIVGRPNRVTLWKGTTQQIVARTPEGLIKREMGWTLPVRHLMYWIRGIAAPGRQRNKTDQYGHLIMLQQNGWTIYFSHYTSVEGDDLPQKIILKHPNVKVSIVVKRWSYSG